MVVTMEYTFLLKKKNWRQKFLKDDQNQNNPLDQNSGKRWMFPDSESVPQCSLSHCCLLWHISYCTFPIALFLLHISYCTFAIVHSLLHISYCEFPIALFLLRPRTLLICPQVRHDYLFKRSHSTYFFPFHSGQSFGHVSICPNT